MPWAFIQRIGIRKRKLTTTRSTLMRHDLSYRGRLRSSNARAKKIAQLRFRSCESHHSNVVTSFAFQ
jgi:hypothetical protein